MSYDTTVSPPENNTAAAGAWTVPYQSLPEYRTAMTVRVVAICMIVPLATVGNLLSVVVLLRKSLRHSTTSLYLISLALVDLAVVYCVCLTESISKLTGHFLENRSDAWCKFSFFNTHLTRQVSSWILVLVSVERVIAVYLPLKAKKVCSRKAGAIALLITAIVMALLSGRLFFTRHLTKQGECRSPSDLAHFASKISPWIIKVFYWLAPSIFMVFTNTLILVKFRLIAKRGSGRSADKVANNTIIILVATTTFILTTTPLSLFFILNPGWNIQAAEVKVKYELRYALLQSWAYLNHAVNFLLYVTSAPVFRRELVALLSGIFKCKQQQVTPDNSSGTNMIASRRHLPSASNNEASSRTRVEEQTDQRFNGLSQNQLRRKLQLRKAIPDRRVSSTRSVFNVMLSSQYPSQANVDSLPSVAV